MKITLFKNLNEEKKVRKTLDYLTTLEGYLRDSASLEFPIFTIESDGIIDDAIELQYDNEDIEADDYELEVNFNDSILICNYIYVEEFGRYYYVSDIEIYNNRLYIFKCEEDYLMSHKEKFLSLKALISRNQYLNDTFIEDTLQPFKFELSVEENDINTSNADLTFNPSINDNYDTKHTYVISYMATGGLNYNDRVIDSPNNILPDISDTVAGINNCTRIEAMSLAYVKQLASYIIDHDSDSSFIMSIMSYPFEVESSGLISQLYLGNTSATNVFTYKMNSAISKYYKIGEFKVSSYSYMDIEPYTKYELYLPYYGYLELASSDILDSDVDIYYSFEYATGKCKINIVNRTKGYIITSVNGVIGINIPLSRTNYQQLNDEKTQTAIKTTIGVIGSMISMAGGVASGNPFMTAGAVTGLTSTIADSLVKMNQQHLKGNVANATGYDGLYGCQTPRLKKTKYQKHNITDFQKYFGLPINQEYTLSGLSGLTIVKEIHLEGIDATKNEIDNLYALLKEGIIL